MVSCIGLGGFHLGQSRLEEADAIKLFQGAVDRGINFSDNSWDYNQGESERRVGKALKGRRDKVFVMSKFDGRTKESALKQLDDSLQRLEVITWTFGSSTKTFGWKIPTAFSPMAVRTRR
jgi:aryl-alcohol dehydrogenase-like predicted oxidoreductase